MSLPYSIFFWILILDLLAQLLRLSKVQNYQQRKVWMKKSVKTHPRFTKLHHNYIYTITHRSTDFHQDGMTTHWDEGVLLWGSYSGVILFIGIATKHNELNTIWGCGQLSGQGPVYDHPVRIQKSDQTGDRTQAFWTYTRCSNHWTIQPCWVQSHNELYVSATLNHGY